MGFLGKISGFLGQVQEKFSEFWDIWVKLLVVFGLGLELLGLVWVGISWDLGVLTQPKTHVFWVQMYGTQVFYPSKTIQ